MRTLRPSSPAPGPMACAALRAPTSASVHPPPILAPFGLGHATGRTNLEAT
jgi:hypothetical protein